MQSVGVLKRTIASAVSTAKRKTCPLWLFGQTASLASCGVFVCRDLSSARMQLRGIIKQTEEKFSDTEAFTAIIAALQHTEQAMQRLKSKS